MQLNIQGIKNKERANKKISHTHVHYFIRTSLIFVMFVMRILVQPGTDL